VQRGIIVKIYDFVAPAAARKNFMSKQALTFLARSALNAVCPIQMIFRGGAGFTPGDITRENTVP
jgi:hypothetical protein